MLPQSDQLLITVSTLTRWINSCQLQEQVDMCRNAIQCLVDEKFREHIDAFDLTVARTELNELILAAEKRIAYDGALHRSIQLHYLLNNKTLKNASTTAQKNDHDLVTG